MTNADCIRRMNDEQLYNFLSEWECGDIDYSITFCDLCKQGGNELNLDCDGCRKHWLQRDAVEYGGLMYWKKNTTFDATADRKTEPQTETKIAKAIVHRMIDDAVIAEDAYPNLRQKMHDAVDEYEPQTETKTETQNSNLTFKKRTMRDCYNCKRYETEGECIECHYEPKDEPQTDCPWK